ncbi:hypothetical protein ElyMa_003224700 [Elysia marginata]|uniref:Uncharacterized protein n=1 Tax=Elysia marginata TaxID=1093978 RepID=A0AAV4J399_9GAST|nr:hypothetical protein ElyMa_003224700 [Elysia marginata]
MFLFLGPASDERAELYLWDEDVSDLSSPPQGVVNPGLTPPAVPPRKGRLSSVNTKTSNSTSNINPNPTPTTSVSQPVEQPCSPHPSEGFVNATCIPTLKSPHHEGVHRPKGIPPARLSLPVHDKLSGLDALPSRDRICSSQESRSSLQHDGHREPGHKTMGAHGSSVVLSDRFQDISENPSKPCHLVAVTRSNAGRNNCMLNLALQESSVATREDSENRSKTHGRMKAAQNRNSVKSVLLQDGLASSATHVYSDGVVLDAAGSKNWADYPSAVAADGAECCDPNFATCLQNNANTHSALRNKSSFWTSQGYVSAMERRRRNFSSSSLPLSLMTTHTIEEVDDTEETTSITGGVQKTDIKQNKPPFEPLNPQQRQYANPHQQRSNSYGGSISPRAPRIPLRVLRREARVPSMGSPPRSHHVPSCTSTSCPACSDNSPVATDQNNVAGTGNANLNNSSNTSPCNSGPPSEADTTLSDVDIVGESFSSRYPWQRDVGIQCFMPTDVSLKSLTSADYRLQYSQYGRLHRAAPGPGFFRSLSASSNNASGCSPCSSPPLVPGTPQHRLYLSQRYSDNLPGSANISPSDQSYQHQMSQGNVQETGLPFEASAQGQPRHKPPLYRSQTASPVTAGCAVAAQQDMVNNAGSPSQGSPFSTRRANFKRRPRPSSMGAVENIR